MKCVRACAVWCVAWRGVVCEIHKMLSVPLASLSSCDKALNPRPPVTTSVNSFPITTDRKYTYGSRDNKKSNTTRLINTLCFEIDYAGES